MIYVLKTTNSFKKQLKKLKKRNKDLNKMKIVVDKLLNGEILDEKYRDHDLISSCPRFKNCKELHIEPDWLLVYRIFNDNLILVLVETGTHSDLF